MKSVKKKFQSVLLCMKENEKIKVKNIRIVRVVYESFRGIEK